VLGTLVWIVVFVYTSVEFANANPYLAKPGEPVARARVGTCAVTREEGTSVRRKSADIFDNTFVENLEKRRLSKGTLERRDSGREKETLTPQENSFDCDKRIDPSLFVILTFFLPNYENRVKPALR
jgi:hypothetical protein